MLFSLLLIFYGSTIFANTPLSRTYSKKIDVSPDVKVKVNGPRSIHFNMHGQIHTAQTKEGYQMMSGSANSPVNLKVKNYQVHTWTEAVVQQEIIVEVLPSQRSPEDAEALLNHLEITLEREANGDILIDDNMNIKSLEFVNAWFKVDRNTVILNDGSSYNIESLSIASHLYVPTSSHLELVAKYVGVFVDDLEGTLWIHSRGGFVEAGNVGTLKANLWHSKATFKNIGQAEVNAKAAKFSAENINELHIGSALLDQHPFLELPPILLGCNRNGKLSELTKYYLGDVGKLAIEESTNDQFTLRSVGELIAKQSTFSNYTIESCRQSLDISAKSGDLTIQQVQSGFKYININNNISTVTLGLKKTPNFKLYLDDNPFTKYTIAPFLKEREQKEKGQSSYQIGEEQKAGKIDIRCASCKVILK